MQNTAQWEAKNMVSWDVPDVINANCKAIPNRLYVHKDFVSTLDAWFMALFANNLLQEIKTYDGCWVIRKKRGGKTMSIHSWAMAIDFNAVHNPLGLSREQCLQRGLTPFSEKFIAISRQYVDCGADWKRRPDGMHFQTKP